MSKQIADLIIHGDAMFTATDKNSSYTAGGIAIAGGKIIAVGHKEQLLTYAGEHTLIKEYGKDKLIMPAFFDSHLHLEETIYAEMGPMLRWVESEEKCIENIKSWHQDNSTVEWIVGFGWQFSHWAKKEPPTKNLLSQAFPDIPVCLVDVDFHAAWVNQKALDSAGITATTKNPVGGIIYKDQNGEPTGYLEELALYMVFDLAKKYLEGDRAWREQSLLKTIEVFHKRGIISVMNAFPLTEVWCHTIADLSSKEDLNFRINLTTTLNPGENFMDEVRRLAELYPDPKASLCFWGVKVIVDGVGGTRTAWMTDPYADAPDTYGYPLLDEDILRRRMLEALKNGYGIHCHACGSRAAQFCLDVIEEAAELGYLKPELRNTITHNDTVNSRDFARYGQFEVIANMQPEMLCPTHSYADNLYPQRLGELLANSWANRSLFDNTGYVSFSSDSPVTLPNPMHGIYRATQRIHDDGTPKEGIHPEQKVSLSESLWAYTYAAAYQLNREQLLGSLEIGKLGDVIVLDKNIFLAAPEEYRSIESELTIFNGKIVYQK